MTLTSSAQALLVDAVRRGVFPGAAWAYGNARESHIGSHGSFTYKAGSAPITVGSWFDLASLTKPLYTTTLAMRAIQRDHISLSTPVSLWLPEFTGGGKERVTVEHLLRHESGLAAHEKLWLGGASFQEGCDRLFAQPLEAAPGERPLYSCLGYLVLGLLLVQVAKSEQSTTLAGPRLSAPPFYNTRAIAQIEEFFHVRGGLRWSHEVPAGDSVPTELNPTTGWATQGTVHDENAALFRGAAGNAGLFGTIHGVAQLARAMALHDYYDEHASLFQQFTAIPSDPLRRPLGWDRRAAEGSSAGSHFGPKSFGHLGFTGTSFWIDPEAQAYIVLLTNRIHPTRENEAIKEFRPAFHDCVMAALKE